MDSKKRQLKQHLEATKTVLHKELEKSRQKSYDLQLDLNVIELELWKLEQPWFEEKRNSQNPLM
jgi:hypothetical protein